MEFMYDRHKPVCHVCTALIRFKAKSIIHYNIRQKENEYPDHTFCTVCLKNEHEIVAEIIPTSNKQFVVRTNYDEMFMACQPCALRITKDKDRYGNCYKRLTSTTGTCQICGSTEEQLSILTRSD